MIDTAELANKRRIELEEHTQNCDTCGQLKRCSIAQDMITSLLSYWNRKLVEDK